METAGRKRRRKESKEEYAIVEEEREGCDNASIEITVDLEKKATATLPAVVALPQSLFMPFDATQNCDIFTYILIHYLDTPDLAPIYFTSKNMCRIAHGVMLRRQEDYLCEWSFPTSSSLHHVQQKMQCEDCHNEITHHIHTNKVPSLPSKPPQITWWTKHIRDVREDDLTSPIHTGDLPGTMNIMHKLPHRSAHWLSRALHRVSVYNQHHMLEELLTRNARPLDTVMGVAAKYGHVQVIEQMMKDEHGHIDYEIINRQAVIGGKFEVLEWLKVRGFISRVAYEEAGTRGRVDVLEWLMKFDPKSTENYQPRDILDCASYSGHIQVLNWLYERKVVPSYVHLEHGAESGSSEVFQWLFDHMAPASWDPSDVLPQAIIGGSSDLVRRMMNEGAHLTDLPRFSDLTPSKRHLRERQEAFIDMFSLLLSVGFDFKSFIRWAYDSGAHRLFRWMMSVTGVDEKECPWMKMEFGEKIRRGDVEIRLWMIGKKWGVTKEKHTSSRSMQKEESVDQLLANLNVSLKLQEKEERWKLLEQRMNENLAKVSQKITLDVGGKRYTTSKDTLTSIPNTYFTGLLGSGHWKPEADGSYFIDRDRKLFHYVLQLLRTGEMSIDTLSEQQKKDLKRELEYFLIPWPTVQLDTSNMLGKGNRERIEQWIGEGKKMGERLYKATEHGFQSSVFHHLCDGKGPTVVVVQSDNDSIFGGYSDVSWSSTGGHTASLKSFLFALKNPHRLIARLNLKVPGTPEYAINCAATAGPTFGGGYDFHICNGSNINNGSYSNLPHTYEDTTGKGTTLFTGARNFRTKDIEVYKVI
ncbi:hypothetical protein PROFUN_02033 [Planoprotostelium fungivorum]|uniref:TLDc domain-containing protein n=1 Tax=Planoprotostelium fungivorum TaxID=1890364 RepID=A0A2P6NB76_9EUKA|nr:hypothetical protein PROFUN_02033 [Planoprotostelium fungivorum]